MGSSVNEQYTRGSRWKTTHPQLDFFDDLFDTANSEPLPVDEMDQYLSSTVNDGHILTYWHDKEEIWPKLSQCAKCRLVWCACYYPACQPKQSIVLVLSGHVCLCVGRITEKLLSKN